MKFVKIAAIVLVWTLSPKFTFAMDFKEFFTSSDPLHIAISALIIMVSMGAIIVVGGAEEPSVVVAGIAVAGIVVVVRILITGSITLSMFISILVILGGTLGIAILLFMIGGIVYFFRRVLSSNYSPYNTFNSSPYNMASVTNRNALNRQNTISSLPHPSVSLRPISSSHNQYLNSSHHSSPSNYFSSSRRRQSINGQQLQPILQKLITTNKPVEYQGLRLDMKYHGTSSKKSALDIFHGKNWVVGPGTANGRGVYLAPKAIARGYAGESGALVRVFISAPIDQFIFYYTVCSSHEFKKYRSQNPALQFGDAITNFTTGILGKRFIINNDVVVALAPKTQLGQRVVFDGLLPVCVLDLNGSVIS